MSMLFSFLQIVYDGEKVEDEYHMGNSIIYI